MTADLAKLGKTELLAAKAALDRADMALSHARGIFISAGYVPGAASVNSALVHVHYLAAQISRALARKPST